MSGDFLDSLRMSFKKLRLTVPNIRNSLPPEAILHIEKPPVMDMLTDGLVFGFCGRRGKSKSLLMSACVKSGYFRKMFDAPTAKTTKANFETDFSDPFNLMQLMNFTSGVDRADIMWDEIGRDMASMRGQTLVAEFVGKQLEQIRKRMVYFYWAAQDATMLTGSLLYQTDFIINCDFECQTGKLCRENRNNGGAPHLRNGKHFSWLQMIDLHGILPTSMGPGFSYPWNVFAEPVGKRQPVDDYFGCYDTGKIFDVFERMRVKIERPKAEILRAEEEVAA